MNPTPKLRLLLALSIVLPVTISCTHLETKKLPLSGEQFSVQGHVAFVILPLKNSSRQPMPWVWYAPTLPGLPSDAEQWMFERFSAAGIAIAGIDVGESYGSPTGCALYSAFFEELTRQRGFAAKPVLLGRSRGGLMLLSWAVDHPTNVAGFAGIYPVADLSSYPGLSKAAPAFHMTETELSTRLSVYNPIDRLAGLARAHVPIFAIHGDDDRVVPLERNSGELKRRYTEFGGPMQLLVPPGQGHNMWPGFFQNPDLLAFVTRYAIRTPEGK